MEQTMLSSAYKMKLKKKFNFSDHYHCNKKYCLSSNTNARQQENKTWFIRYLSITWNNMSQLHWFRQSIMYIDYFNYFETFQYIVFPSIEKTHVAIYFWREPPFQDWISTIFMNIAIPWKNLFTSWEIVYELNRES